MIMMMIMAIPTKTMDCLMSKGNMRRQLNAATV